MLGVRSKPFVRVVEVQDLEPEVVTVGHPSERLLPSERRDVAESLAKPGGVQANNACRRFHRAKGRPGIEKAHHPTG